MNWLRQSGPEAQRRAGIGSETQEPRAVRWGGIDWDDWVRGNVGSTIAISEQSARAVSAVSACVNLIGGSIASIPLHTYRRAQDGDREAYKDALWWLLNERPMSGWSAATMWEYLVSSRLFHGDAFARIHRASRISPTVAGFEPIHPDRIEVRKVDGRLHYVIAPDPQGDAYDTVTRTEVVDQDDMLHIAGPGFNGRRSLSQLQYALRNPAGIAAAADSQSAQFMADGARPDFALGAWRHEGGAAGGSAPELDLAPHRAGCQEGAGGAGRRHETAPADAEQRRRPDDCHAGLPGRGDLPSLRRSAIHDRHTEKTTSWGSGIEQMSIGFVKYTLQRHLVAIEQELNHKLFKTSRNFCEFVTAGLERGDTKSRFEAYRIALAAPASLPG